MKIIFLDNSTIVLQTLKTLVLELIENKEIECEFIDDERHLYRALQEQTLEFEILFSEITLQNISGYEVAKYARTIEKYQDKRIVAITTLFKDEEKQKGLDIGIDAWFVKSITQDSLQKSILECIELVKKELGE